MANNPTTINVPLAAEKRTHLPTAEAAAHLSLRPNTLRRWACYGTGPLQPKRIGGRLYWGVSELLALPVGI